MVINHYRNPKLVCLFLRRRCQRIALIPQFLGLSTGWAWNSMRFDMPPLVCFSTNRANYSLKYVTDSFIPGFGKKFKCFCPQGPFRRRVGREYLPVIDSVFDQNSVNVAFKFHHKLNVRFIVCVIPPTVRTSVFATSGRTKTYG